MLALLGLTRANKEETDNSIDTFDELMTFVGIDQDMSSDDEEEMNEFDVAMEAG